MGLRESLARFARAFNCLTFSALFTCRSEIEGQVDRRGVAAVRRAGGVWHAEVRDSARARGQRCRVGVRSVAAICGRAVHAAAGRLPAAGDAARRDREFADDRRNVASRARIGPSRPAATSSRRFAPSRPDRGGKVLILARRNELPNVSAEEIADLERLHYAVGNSIALHKYSGASLPTKRGKGLEYTLGEDAVSLGRRTGYDYALFLYAAGQYRLDRANRAPGARRRRLLHRLLRSERRKQPVRLCFARRSRGPARSSGSTCFRRAASFPASSSATSARRQGAAQMVERLVGRMKPGREVREPGDGEALMCMRCAELSRRSLACRRRRAGRVDGDRRRPGANTARGHGPADRARASVRRIRTRRASGS